MGNHDDRAFIGSEVLLQPQQGFEIQMVGGLIQNQQLRFAQKELGQGQAGLFPAGEGGNHRSHIFILKTHAIEDGFDFHVDEVAVVSLEISQIPVIFPGQGVVIR